MSLQPTRSLTAAAVVAVTVLALTACTNASDDTASGPSAGTASFDPSTVQKDDALAGLVPAAIRSKGTLVIGSDTTFAPAEFLGGSDGQTAMGYDVDLAKAIGATLGLKVDVQSASFTSILPALGPKYDLGVSNFFVKKERLQAVNMVTYAVGGSAWAVQAGNPKHFSPDDVCGKTLGVQTGSVQADDAAALNTACSKAGKKAVDIITLDKQTDITTRLINGSVDAMVSGSDVVGYAIQQSHGQIEKIGETYGSAPVGIAIAKNDSALASLVQKTIAKLIADGDYRKILDSWNVADIAVTGSQLNPETAS
ncbi:ABC transporter substrate-binding protein [Arthrobacter sp. NPDC090010]|uniref:ABC transporter substrate-binding protein n=1 Tax=Arthrobacter sp. NPDC090010 TaxID=3363942 RepID=UPI00381FDE63